MCIRDSSFFDLAVGNVPFGSYSLSDKRYDKNHFLIHDYFFARTLDKVRPGGIIAFVTSKGTLDKANSSVRRYLAQRADLLGAIRLPNNAFQMCIRDSSTTGDGDHFIDVSADLPEFSLNYQVDGETVATYPVSYTHLDVYKRQPLRG